MLNIFRRKDVVTRFVVGSILVFIALAMVITLIVTGSIYGLMFFDAGNSWLHRREIKPITGLYRGVGLGFRVFRVVEIQDGIAKHDSYV